MDTRFHPERNLSLPQLVSALNQELKLAVYSPSCVTTGRRCPLKRCADPYRSFGFNEVSQLDKDITTALAAVREWRNSFIPINRIPLDILPLIPSHLPSHNDRFRASFVCRHWRRTFLQHAELWSELFLSKGGEYVKTLLGRAKGSVLDVSTSSAAPLNTMVLLSTHTRQIRRLDFLDGQWWNIQMFSEVNSGPFPLLRTLTIDISRESILDVLGNAPPLQPLFNDAVNLKILRLYSKSMWSPSLTRLVFPNLTSFDFSTTQSEDFLASGLLDFLEASPMLRVVHMKIVADISFEAVSQERIVVLPNVESFNLVTSDGGPGYETAVHISCPSATFTSLTIKKGPNHSVPEEIFPALASWNAIVCQYTRNPVEEVTVEIKTSFTITSRLTFRSADGTVIELCFEVALESHSSLPEIPPSFEEIRNETLVQATKIVQNHPQLANVKRLHVCHSFHSEVPSDVSNITNEVGQLFKAVGPLDELTIYDCDVRPYLHSFLPCLERDVEEPVVFPPTKKLTISHPKYASSEVCVAIVELAKSQHALGTPFECVVLRKEKLPQGIKAALRPWVGSVECCHERPHDSVWSPG